MIRFLFCADIHFDAQFLKYPSEVREYKRAFVAESFDSMIDYIIDNDIPVCLIAGDFFDTPDGSRFAITVAKEGFARASGCTFFISPGNHDPYIEGGAWMSNDYGKNVVIFNSENLSKVSLDRYNADIHGYAFMSREMTVNPFSGKKIENIDPDRISVLVAHGDTTDMNSVSCPISVGDIRESGFDMVCIGHIHNPNPAGILKAGSVYWGYSGCLCGKDFGETGVKGAYDCTLEKENGEINGEFKFVPFGKSRYYVDSVDVTGASSDSDVANILKSHVSANGYDMSCFVRFILTGEVGAEYLVQTGTVKALMHGLVSEIEIVDKTSAMIENDELLSDIGIKGEFYRQMLPYLNSDDDNERKKAVMALRFGLGAMAGENLDEI